jgi:hypothetical protein
MPEKIFKDKCRVRVVEYEVRTIDEFGDSQDVAHYDTKREALAAAQLSLASARAVVVEKHTSRYPAFMFPEPNTYKPISAMGDKTALDTGGWTLP